MAESLLRRPRSLRNSVHACGGRTPGSSATGIRNIPPLLKKIYDPPPFLYCRGGFTAGDAAAVAVVGTRNPTPYGLRVAEKFATELAERRITVVSGLARGIDTVAHHAALRAGGRTIAVIGSGLDIIYPAENIPLASRIARQGAVSSEFAMGAKPDAVNFPQRNRIISGVSLGTLVVETGTEGGAMITARAALDQNREVFAIPSPVDAPSPSGTNALIREGRAQLTESIDDILAELSSPLKGLIDCAATRPVQPPPPLTLFEQRLYDQLAADPLHIDLLSEHTGFSTAESLVHLLSLEFKGVVRQLPGKFFVRR